MATAVSWATCDQCGATDLIDTTDSPTVIKKVLVCQACGNEQVEYDADPMA